MRLIYQVDGTVIINFADVYGDRGLEDHGNGTLQSVKSNVSGIITLKDTRGNPISGLTVRLYFVTNLALGTIEEVYRTTNYMGQISANMTLPDLLVGYPNFNYYYSSPYRVYCNYSQIKIDLPISLYAYSTYKNVYHYGASVYVG